VKASPYNKNKPYVMLYIMNLCTIILRCTVYNNFVQKQLVIDHSVSLGTSKAYRQFYCCCL